MPVLRSIIANFISLLAIMPILPTYAAQRSAEPLSMAVDANHASAQELQIIKGIGPRKATSIVEERQQHGLFIDAQDLTRVKGIGSAMANKLKQQLTFRRP